MMYNNNNNSNNNNNNNNNSNNNNNNNKGLTKRKNYRRGFCGKRMPRLACASTHSDRDIHCPYEFERIRNMNMLEDTAFFLRRPNYNFTKQISNTNG